MNFGQRAFAYTAPSGFKCLVSTNLPVTNGIGASASTLASKYFNPVLYTGNGSTQSITGVGFQPDLTWIKSRSTATEWHVLSDAARGTNNLLYSNNDFAAATVTNVFNSFDSDGFSVGYNAALTNARVNTNTGAYVAWNWKAASSGVTNNDGSITSTVRANQTNGVSIITYTGTGANGTVGTGLGAQAKMVIVKERNNVDSWVVWHTSIAATTYLVLNSDASPATAAGMWNSTAPSTSAPWVFSLGTNTAANQSGQQYLAYCFSEVSSFSSFGVYTGDVTNLPFIYTGFRPAFVMFKNIAVGANQPWVIKDDLRAAAYNPATGNLYPNLANAEDVIASVYVDLVSNGFKIQGTYAGINQGTSQIIYAAFAEFPFRYSRAR
jgi:hypothetical protein